MVIIRRLAPPQSGTESWDFKTSDYFNKLGPVYSLELEMTFGLSVYAEITCGTSFLLLKCSPGDSRTPQPSFPRQQEVPAHALGVASVHVGC